jgi:hypothetical protein
MRGIDLRIRAIAEFGIAFNLTGSMGRVLQYTEADARRNNARWQKAQPRGR